jgi:hypothetical protein
MIVVDNLAPHVRVIPPDALVRLLAVVMSYRWCWISWAV